MMFISGFIDSDYDNWATVGDETFCSYMKDYAKDYGLNYSHEYGLGGEKTIIFNCNIRMYFSDKKMSFEEAETKFLDKFLGNDTYEMEANRIGYSEWTIIGYELTECRLGGHDLNEILLSHIGEYVNIEVETN